MDFVFGLSYRAADGSLHRRITRPSEKGREAHGILDYPYPLHLHQPVRPAHASLKVEYRDIFGKALPGALSRRPAPRADPAHGQEDSPFPPAPGIPCMTGALTDFSKEKSEPGNPVHVAGLHTPERTRSCSRYAACDHRQPDN